MYPWQKDEVYESSHCTYNYTKIRIPMSHLNTMMLRMLENCRWAFYYNITSLWSYLTNGFKERKKWVKKANTRFMTSKLLFLGWIFSTVDFADQSICPLLFCQYFIYIFIFFILWLHSSSVIQKYTDDVVSHFSFNFHGKHILTILTRDIQMND